MLQETFLEVLSFVDYATLVLLKLSSKGLLRFVDRYAEKLAVRKAFLVACTKNKLEVSNAGEGWLHSKVVNVDPNDTERTAALAELKAIIGPHVVQNIGFYEARIPIRSLIEAIPAARNALNIYISEPPSTAERYVEDILEFHRAERMDIHAMPLDGLLALMKHNVSSKVTWLSVTPPLPNKIGRIVHPDAESDILRFCMDSDTQREHETKRIRLEYWTFGWTFVERLIEALTQSDRLRTVTISAPEGLTETSLETGSGLSVHYWELPLSDALFETKGIAISNFLRSVVRRWIKLAHFSRQSDVVVSISHHLLTVTNNAKHIENETDYFNLVY